MIVALGKACELERLHLADFMQRVTGLREYFEAELTNRIPNISRNGDSEGRVPHITNFNFDHCEGEGLMISLDLKGIAVSTGSACASGSIEPSHVLTAMGLSAARAQGSIRLSLGIYNTDADVDHLLEHLPLILVELRNASKHAVKLHHKPHTVVGA